MVDWHYISGLYLRHVLSSAISYSRTSIVVSICYTAKIGIFLRKNENTLLHLIMVSFGSVDASYSRRSIVVRVCYSANLAFSLKNEKTWFDCDHLHIFSVTIWVC